MQFSNPFDNPQGQFYILRNDQQQYSLWPAHCDLPAGWAVVCPPQSAEACNAWLEVIRLLRLSIWVERLLIPWEVDIEVIWDNIWALSTGLNGS